MRKVKKIMSLVVAVLMVAGMTSMMASADGSVNLNLKADKASIKAGETVVVSVAFDQAISGFQGDITYDAAVFDYQGAELEASIADEYNAVEDSILNDAANNKVTFVAVGNVSDPAVLDYWVKLTFVAKAEAAAADYTFGAANVVISDAEGNAMENVVNSATVTIAPEVVEEPALTSEVYNLYAYMGGWLEEEMNIATGFAMYEDTVGGVLANVTAQGGTAKIFNADGTEAGNDDYIASGMEIALVNEENAKLLSYTVIVFGDLDGDGELTLGDGDIVVQIYKDSVAEYDWQYVAADTSLDEDITLDDKDIVVGMYKDDIVDWPTEYAK